MIENQLTFSVEIQGPGISLPIYYISYYRRLLILIINIFVLRSELEVAYSLTVQRWNGQWNVRSKRVLV